MMFCCGGREWHRPRCWGYRPNVRRELVCGACGGTNHATCVGRRLVGRNGGGPIGRCMCWCRWDNAELLQQMNADRVPEDVRDRVQRYVVRLRRRRGVRAS